MEIIKQLYDISALISYIDDFSEVKSSYFDIVKTELVYRSITANAEDACVMRFRQPPISLGQTHQFEKIE